jgi:GNAT superfamily N-acetyltransferase/predicted enzyme related to lactoylglutathione lyase
MEILVNIDVHDLDRATDFYCSVSGLTVGRRFGDNGVELVGGAARVYLLRKASGTPVSTSSNDSRRYDRHWTPVHLDFVVDDIDLAIRRAVAAGARAEQPVTTSRWGKLALMADPFGHGFCFVQFLGRGYDEIANDIIGHESQHGTEREAEMHPPPRVRAITAGDYGAWRPLWDGYNAFYGRRGVTALADDITQTTWKRFLDPHEPMFALVAELDSKIVGLTHYVFHRSTTRLEQVCYLSDLFTLPSHRGRGIGRALIEGVYAQARAAGASEVYWQTHDSNSAGRLLYDKVAKHNGYIVYETPV